MAGRIAGIVIEIGGDTTRLQTALKGVDNQLKQTQSKLKDIDKLLKLDPTNTELLRQKQQGLKDAIQQTKDRLQQLKDAQSGVAQGTPEWDALQREIIATEQNLSQLEDEYRAFGSVASQVVKQAGKEISEFGKKISDVGNKFKPVSAAAAGLLTGMGGLGLKAASNADDLNTLAKQTGLTTEQIQKMQYASDLVDVSLDDITGALRKMKPKMTEGNDTFKALGVSIKDADGNLRSATDVFYDSLSALSKVENETERDQLAMALFGKSADELAGIIDDGGKALQEYGEEADRLGLILDQDTLDALNTTNDALDRMKGQLRGQALKLGAKIAQAATPIVEKLAGVLERVANWLDTLTPQQVELALTIAAVVAAIAPVLIIVGKLVTGIGMLISAFGFLLSPVGLVIAAIAAVIAIGILLYKNWDTIKAKAEELKNNLVAAWQQMKANISEKIAQIKAEAIAKWEEIKTGLANKTEEMKNAVYEKVEELRQKIANVVTRVQAKFEELKNKIKAISDSIRNFFNFQVSLPHIPLPHFAVSPPGWTIGDLVKGIIPSLSVVWYKKAMDNPILFTSPTVMQTPYGLKGFGDAGAEIVMGLDKLRELVGSQNMTVNVVLQGDAKGLFKVVRQENYMRTRATNYNALGVAGA